MIKNRKNRIACDNRDTITTGEKSEKGIPVALPYFNIKAFPELIQAYGQKPTELYVMFPSDIITDFFDCFYMRYGKNKKEEGVKIRQCDGIECMHRIDESVAGCNYHAGEITPCICNEEIPEKERCKYNAWLKAWIVNPITQKISNHLCYLFETRSKNSGDTIHSELEKIQWLNNGILRGIPFKLSVKMVSGTKALHKFPIWELSAVSISQLSTQTVALLNETNNVVDGIKKDMTYANGIGTLKHYLDDNYEAIKKLSESDRAEIKKHHQILVGT